MTVLVLVAHPDDEVLGCGGTIAKLARDGHDVQIRYFTDGVGSRGSILSERERRAEQAKAAVEILGAEIGSGQLFPDNAMDSVPLLLIAKAVERVVDEIRPDLIYTHHAHDLNIDHRKIHEAVMIATRPAGGSVVREIRAFEVPSSTEWGFEFTFHPNVFVDITPYLNIKFDAMEAYREEMRPWPHPRSIRALQARAEYWGQMIGLEAAEAFEIVRRID